MSRKLRALAATAAAGLFAAVLAVATQPAQADELVTHHEFQANCSVTTHRPDDPIVFPGLPGASHMHTFLGNNSTNAGSTDASLKAGQTNCRTPDDKSAYWFPSLEFKIAFPVSGDMSRVRLSSGRGYTWHYDFMNAWDGPTLQALVSHCVNGGLQCDPRGYDQYKPHRGAALGPDHRLPR
ncbi:DUF1996 domain-containing protein [Actinosynnema sp. NPDC050801]|uniref:DUF1996 domain-containing protein n=1 Tax=unclassified Actinosynnema TaxID=2637065 RepID=UPI0033DFF011